MTSKLPEKASEISAKAELPILKFSRLVHTVLEMIEDTMSHLRLRF